MFTENTGNIVFIWNDSKWRKETLSLRISWVVRHTWGVRGKGCTGKWSKYSTLTWYLKSEFNK